MNISALIEEAKAAGVCIYLRNGKVKHGSDEAMGAIRPRLASYRAELLPYLIRLTQHAGEFWPWAVPDRRRC